MSKASGCVMETLFGEMWAWDEFPNLKPAYEKELAEYAAALPAAITSRTDLKELPSPAWYIKYVPDEKALEALREARKTPEQRADEERARTENTARIAEEHRQKEAARAERARAADELKQKYFFLSTDLSRGSGVAASSNIKKLLSTLWPSVKFSVHYKSFAGGDSIDARWADGPSAGQVDDYIGNFESGSFDGSEDIYNYHDNAWHIFGDAKYIHAHRDISEEKINELLPAVKTVVDNMGNPDASREIGTTGFSVYGNRDGEFNLYVPEGLEHYSKRFSPHYGDVARQIAIVILEYGTMAESILPSKNDIPSEKNDSSGISTNGSNEMRLATIRKNEDKNGIEVQFPEKPHERIISFLKIRGFRWSKFAKLWYAKYTESLMKEVMATIA
jgi:hypothetical protein